MASKPSVNDEESQVNEIESLESIYDDDIRVFTDTAGKRSISINIQLTSEGRLVDHTSIIMEIAIPLDYPSNSSPTLSFISCDCLDNVEKKKLINDCESLFIKNEVIIYQWIEMIKECLNQKTKVCHTSQVEDFSPLVEEPSHHRLPIDTKQANEEQPLNDDGESLAMCHGEPFTDRRSTFQAHVAEIHSLEELERKLKHLKSNRKILVATHNILAYRFFDSSKHVLIQDCDDDGESAAGGRLLHLLQIMDVINAVVVVSRWYGGIQLGPDRFKHINNVARTLLLSSGIVEKQEISSVKRKGKQRKR